MSRRTKIAFTLLSLVMFLLWKVWDFYQYVAIFYTPDELRKRSAPWKSLLQQYLFTRSVALISTTLFILFLLVIWLYEPTVRRFRRKTDFDKLAKQYGEHGFCRARWGQNPKWLENTTGGQSLLERAVFCLRKTQGFKPQTATHVALDVDPNFLPGIPKELRLTFPNGQCVSINEGAELRLDFNTQVFRDDMDQQEDGKSPIAAISNRKLRIAGYKLQSTPATDEHGRVSNSMYIQLQPRCLTDNPVVRCEGHLIRVFKKKSESEWEPSSLNESLPLKWSFRDDRETTLNPRVETLLDVCHSNSRLSWLIPDTHGGVPNRAVGELQIAGTFSFDILITASDCAPVDVSLEVLFQDKQWDKSVCRLWSGLTMDPKKTEIHQPIPSIKDRRSLQPDAARYISEDQRKTLKVQLAKLPPQKFDVIRVGFTDDKETADYAQAITLALMDCGWAGWFHEENIHINLGETKNYAAGISLFALGHQQMSAMVALKEAMEAAGIRLAPCFVRPSDRPGNSHVIEIVVGPNSQIIKN